MALFQCPPHSPLPGSAPLQAHPGGRGVHCAMERRRGGMPTQLREETSVGIDLQFYPVVRDSHPPCRGLDHGKPRRAEHLLPET